MPTDQPMLFTLEHDEGSLPRLYPLPLLPRFPAYLRLFARKIGRKGKYWKTDLQMCELAPWELSCCNSTQSRPYFVKFGCRRMFQSAGRTQGKSWIGACKGALFIYSTKVVVFHVFVFCSYIYILGRYIYIYYAVIGVSSFRFSSNGHFFFSSNEFQLSVSLSFKIPIFPRHDIEVLRERGKSGEGKRASLFTSLSWRSTGDIVRSRSLYDRRIFSINIASAWWWRKYISYFRWGPNLISQHSVRKYKPHLNIRPYRSYIRALWVLQLWGGVTTPRFFQNIDLG